MIVVFHDEFTDQSSINSRESQAIVEAAHLFGCRIVPLPRDFQSISLEDAFAYIPDYDPPIIGVWVGFIPDPERYTAVYHAAVKKGIYLVNSPEQHQLAMVFDQLYPLIKDLTPKSVVLQSTDEIPIAEQEIGYPCFIKGAVKSNKDEGWNSVIAYNRDDLFQKIEQLLSRHHRSRGKVIVRQLANLRRIKTAPDGFPLGREYRAFLYNATILANGFYWDEFNDPNPLSQSDKTMMLSLATQAAQRVNVPYISVDLGQLETGEWIVIEIGDGQFSGLSQIPVLELWSKVKDFTPESI